MRYIIPILTFVLFLVIVSGCVRQDQTLDRVEYTGSDGLLVSFVEGHPQNRYLVGDASSEDISIILEIQNKGAWPTDEDESFLSDNGKLFLSGFDRNIIRLRDTQHTFNREALLGLSLINPDGGFDIAEYKGSISHSLIDDQYAPTILATVCYPYQTTASPAVCIDPDPFDLTRDKVCTTGTTSLSTQAAPVAVTSIEQEASSSQIQFKINIANVGGGDLIDIDSLEKCDPSGSRGSLARNDFDMVEVERVSAGTSELDCGPFVTGDRQIRLNNGRGFVICTLHRAEYDHVGSAFTTPLTVELRYGYRTTTAKRISIEKLRGIR